VTVSTPELINHSVWVYADFRAGPDPRKWQFFASACIRTPVSRSSLCIIAFVLTGQVILWKVTNYLNVWANIRILHTSVSQTGFRGTTGFCKGVSGGPRDENANCRRVLLAVLKFMWRHWTLIVPSLIAGRRSIAATIQKLPDSLVKSVSISCHRKSMWQAKRSSYWLVWGQPLSFYM